MSTPMCPRCGRTDYDMIDRCKECNRKFCDFCSIEAARSKGNVKTVTLSPRDFESAKKEMAANGMSKAELDKLTPNTIAYRPICPYCGSEMVEIFM